MGGPEVGHLSWQGYPPARSDGWVPKVGYPPPDLMGVPEVGYPSPQQGYPLPQLDLAGVPSLDGPWPGYPPPLKAWTDTCENSTLQYYVRGR